ncbi:hypothetical protein WKI71_45290 [Streptomyces sp. MS1.AVA.1]|uniref:Uncharacterized protein n=1 Tax=Streptomyces machairae TaxID=3134109 RepID=A0ABU8UWJ3_9ACTN
MRARGLVSDASSAFAPQNRTNANATATVFADSDREDIKERSVIFSA